jgi:hypothetical protein
MNLGRICARRRTQGLKGQGSVAPQGGFQCLDQARLREKELEEAGAEASAALGRAIAEIKAALNGETSDASQTEEA